VVWNLEALGSYKIDYSRLGRTPAEDNPRYYTLQFNPELPKPGVSMVVSVFGCPSGPILTA
jgi:hypothetical protein